MLFVYAGHVNLPSIIIFADFIGFFVHWLCTENTIFIIIIMYDGLKLSISICHLQFTDWTLVVS